MRRIAELPMAQYPAKVGALWRSRNEDLEQEVFERLPDWMEREPDRSQELLDITRLLVAALETLALREAQVLIYRYLHELTLDEIGEIYEVTRERIRQIEARALRKMRHPKRFDHLRQYGELFTGRRRTWVDWSQPENLSAS